MKRLRLLLLLLLLVAGAPAVRAQPSAAQDITFDDSNPALIVLGNSFYQVGISTSNGAIAYIVDTATGRRVSEGSRYGCLWGAYGSNTGYVGGCSYSPGGASRFSYSWSPADSRLTLSYYPVPERTYYAAATVTITASADRWFDMQLQLDNRMSGALDYILFPSDLVLREVDIQAAYLPFLPGVALQPAFFAQNRSYVAAYPGEMFADFMAVTGAAGSLAAYALPDAAGVRPVVLGLNHDDGYVQDSAYYYHTFGARLAAGSGWQSPRVRVRVGAPVGEAVEAFRGDAGIDGLASVAAKAGARYDQLARSPLLKADVSQIGIPFGQYAALLARVTPPALVHLLAYQPGGFDESHPDMLPPAPAWGSTADMAAMMQRAREQGFLVMPYTNPTWWDDESPTMRELIAAGRLAEAATFDEPGVPRYEVYGGHGGYAVSPYAPLVRQRVARLIDDMTVTLPADLVFEDQVGARTWLFDYGPSSPSPTAYAQGWLDHTRAYSRTLLMTENGNDRLAETELGFHGSVLLPEHLGQTDGRWGTGTWAPYPIAPLLLRDKVLLYQHNLAPETFTTSTATLSWNMTFGYMLSYDLGWTNFGGGVDDPWLGVVTALQHDVVARYAGERMLSYTSLGGEATASVFQHASVVTNWSAGASYSYGPHELAPSGFLAATDDGSLTAGVFAAYNGAALSAGDHILVEERGADAVTVRQLLGADTPLTVRIPPEWQGRAVVSAYDAAGAWLGSAAGAAGADSVTFTYRGQVGAGTAARYVVAPGSQIFMPLIALHR